MQIEVGQPKYLDHPSLVWNNYDILGLIKVNDAKLIVWIYLDLLKLMSYDWITITIVHCLD